MSEHLIPSGSSGGGAWEGCETFGRWTWLEQVDLWRVGTEVHSQADLASYPVLVWRDVSKQLDTSTATACCHTAFPTMRERTFNPWPAVIPPLGCFLSGVWSLQWKKLLVQHPRSMTLRDHVEIASIWNQTFVYWTQMVTLRVRREFVHNGETWVFEGKRFFPL